MTKRILVTGGTGFIGSNLIPKLVLEGHEVYALVRNISNRTPTFPEKTKIIVGDLRDGLDLRKPIMDADPNIIVHLAASTSVAYSHLHPQEIFDINTGGTVDLATIASDLPSLEAFLMAGTSEEYGNQKIIPISEDAPLNANQPYAVSKVQADLYLHYLWSSNGFPAIVVRPFNTYGRLENFNFVTESIIVQMLTKKTVYLGNPSPVRDFLYVDDHIEGYLKLIRAPEIVHTIGPNRAINLCTGRGTSIKTLAETIARIMDFDESNIIWKYSNLVRPTEIEKLVGDNSKAKKLLGWSPRTDLESGLSLLIKKLSKKFWSGLRA